MTLGFALFGAYLLLVAAKREAAPLDCGVKQQPEELLRRGEFAAGGLLDFVGCASSAAFFVLADVRRARIYSAGESGGAAVAEEMKRLAVENKRRGQRAKAAVWRCGKGLSQGAALGADGAVGCVTGQPRPTCRVSSRDGRL